MTTMTKAAEDVLAERQRQISVEGWTPEHDDAHGEGELSQAGACYAAGQILYVGDGSIPGIVQKAATIWPWHRDWWTPTDRRRDLVKSGALILAEIERLDRASSKPLIESEPAKYEAVAIAAKRAADSMGILQAAMRIDLDDYNKAAAASQSLRDENAALRKAAEAALWQLSSIFDKGGTIEMLRAALKKGQ